MFTSVRADTEMMLAAFQPRRRGSTSARVPPSSVISTPEIRTPTGVTRLHRSEQWMLNSLERKGPLGFVLTLTIPIVAASLGLCLVSIGFLRGLNEQTLAPAILIGIGVPALVAPPILFLTVGLVARLDEAGKLLRLVALTDPLTGVLNRRGFFEAVENLPPTGHLTQVAMIDVDQFKKINDLHGHPTGDMVLRSVSDWLTTLSDGHGIVARIGGDEFAFVSRIAGSRIAEESSLPNRQSLVVEGVAFSITIGSATFAEEADFGEALARADASLYAVKRQSGTGNP